MATSQQLAEHTLICSFCIKVCRNPCTLDCYHSFCDECLVAFTKTRPDAVTANSIPCPFCHRLTKVPDPDRPVEEWAGQLKPGFVRKGLTDSSGPGPKDTTNCNLCQEEGEEAPATVWCSVCEAALCRACLKVHSRIPATRRHEVAELSDYVKVTNRRKVMCQELKDECVRWIKFYCKNCKKMLCQECRSIYHRTCKSVTSLDAMVTDMRATLEARKESLESKVQDEEKQLHIRKSQCDDIKQRESSIQSQIRSAAQKAMDAIKKKEKQLMDELDEITDEQTSQLDANIDSGDMARQIYKQQCEFIDQVLNTNSGVGMYNLCQSWESGSGECLGDTSVKDTGFRIEYSPDMDKIKKSLNGLSLGTISQRNEDLSQSPVPELKNTIDCTAPNDLMKPDIFDVTSILIGDTEVLVVTDFNNKYVKCFYNRHNRAVHSRLKLKDSPRRIAKLDGDILAVTVHRAKQIVTVKVTPDLSLLPSIPTSKEYCGLTALTPTTLAAGSESPPCVDILDRRGNMLRSISLLNITQTIIKYPHFLCTSTKGNILVSDYGSKAVLCLTPQGDVVFIYYSTGDEELELELPRGITCTDTGDILVVDQIGHKVIQLSETGQFVRDFLTAHDGLSNPYSLHCDEKGRIHVSKDDQFVSVFTFQ